MEDTESYESQKKCCHDQIKTEAISSESDRTGN